MAGCEAESLASSTEDINKAILSKSLKNIDVDRGNQKNLSLNDTSKTLVIKNCTSLQDLIKTLKEKSFKRFLKLSSHCFMINGSNFGDRPLIIEIFVASFKASKIYGKNCGESQLQKVDFVVEKTSENLYEKQMTNLSFDF